jgi:hypothetical protein
MNNIKSLVQKHGISKVKALIKLRPLNTCMSIIAFTSSSDEEMPILCEITEDRYKVDEEYKIGWKSISEYAGFASETFYQSDFNDLVERGQIKLFIEA